MYKIIDIYWQRVNLHLKLNKEIKDKILLKGEQTEIELYSNSNEIVINVTNTPEETMLDCGTWELLIGDIPVTIDTSLICLLDDKSRIFPYRNDLYSYLVRLLIDEKQALNIKIDFMMINKKPKKLKRLVEANNLKDLSMMFFQKLGVICFQVIYYFFCILKKSKNVLFLTENASSLNGNLKYLHDYLKENNKNKYHIYVYAKNRYKEKNKLLDYLKEAILLAKSRVIFLDNYTPLLSQIKLTKSTKIIQLWHAGLGFKAVGYARFGHAGSPHPYQSSHRKYTKVIVDSEELIPIYQEVFGCKKDIILPIGIPRTDKYLDEKVITSVCNELYKNNPMLKSHKVILFAPTFRGEGIKDAHYDFSKINFTEIYNYCQKNKSIFIIKMHPFVKNYSIDLQKYKDYILDYSNYDINNLIYIADIMITDYSSCAYEYSFFNRPIIFYRYDKEIYEYLRSVYTLDVFSKDKYEVTNFEDLMKCLEKLDVNVDNRFKNIIKRSNTDICKNILEKSLGL